MASESIRMELVEPVLDFDRFYGDQFRRALALALSLTGDRSSAEELTQDAFTDAYRRWERISSYDDPGAWVRRVIANRSVSRWRRLAAETKGLLRLGRSTERPAPPTDSVDEAFWAAVRALPARQAQAITLKYLEDMSVEEIAAVLSISAGAVKSHLHRGRSELARTLATETNHLPRPTSSTSARLNRGGPNGNPSNDSEESGHE
jgi:RNA polymerase sigma-70 factor, ECF subfamily